MLVALFIEWTLLYSFFVSRFVRPYAALTGLLSCFYMLTVVVVCCSQFWSRLIRFCTTGGTPVDGRAGGDDG